MHEIGKWKVIGALAQLLGRFPTDDHSQFCLDRPVLFCMHLIGFVSIVSHILVSEICRHRLYQGAPSNGNGIPYLGWKVKKHVRKGMDRLAKAGRAGKIKPMMDENALIINELVNLNRFPWGGNIAAGTVRTNLQRLRA